MGRPIATLLKNLKVIQRDKASSRLRFKLNPVADVLAEKSFASLEKLPGRWEMPKRIENVPPRRLIPNSSMKRFLKLELSRFHGQFSGSWVFVEERHCCVIRRVGLRTARCTSYQCYGSVTLASELPSAQLPADVLTAGEATTQSSPPFGIASVLPWGR